MTHEEILKLSGFDPGDWTIVDAKVAPTYLKEKNAVNCMYEIKDRKAVAVIGKKCYATKKRWLFDTMDIMEAEGRLGKPEAKEEPKVPPPPKNAPSISGLNIPPPPSKKAEEVVQEKLNEIVEESGIPKENVVVTSIPKRVEKPFPHNLPDNPGEPVKTEVEKTELTQETRNVQAEEAKKEIKKDESLPFYVEGGADIPLNEDGSVDTTGMDEADAREAILQHQRKEDPETGKNISKGKAVGTLTAKVTPTEPEKKEEPKVEKPKEEKPKEKPAPTPTATPKQLNVLDVVDDVISACNYLKDAMYTIEAIKTIIEGKDSDEQKLKWIEETIRNNMN